MIILSGSSHPELACNIANLLQLSLLLHIPIHQQQFFYNLLKITHFSNILLTKAIGQIHDKCEIVDFQIFRPSNKYYSKNILQNFIFLCL